MMMDQDHHHEDDNVLRRPSSTCAAAKQLTDDVSLLTLLSDWCNVDTKNIRVGVNDECGHRGLYTTRPLSAGSTLLELPWKHVLGMRAARHLIETETEKGRGMEDEDFLLQVMFVCSEAVPEQHLWSCVMACAILSAVRYPLSLWSPYIACLPHYPRPGHDRMEQALRRTHALTERARRRRIAKEKAGEGSKLSQKVLTELRQVREAIMAVPRHDNEFDHVLMWTKEELQETGDEVLQKEVELDQQFLELIWHQLFSRQNENDAGTPIISLESWMWAHAIVRSRAVGMEVAPRQVLTIDYEGHRFSSQGVLLPIIDLINHDAQSHNAHLEVRPTGVAVMVTKDLPAAGTEILFDYHPNATLRWMLRSYGFVDSTTSSLCCQRQVFALQSVELDIASSKTSSESSTRGMMRLFHTDFDNDNKNKGRLVLMIRDFDDSLIPRCGSASSGLSSLALDEAWIKLHELAAGLCRLWIERFLEHVGTTKTKTTTCSQKSSNSVLYRETTLEMLQRAERDLSAVASLFFFNE